MSEQQSGRPVIYLSHRTDAPHRDLHAIVADAARALGEHAEDVYARDGRLVDVGVVGIFVGKDGRKPKTTPGIGIRELPTSEVKRHLSIVAEWRKWICPGGKKWLDVASDPTPDLAGSVANLGRWAHVRPLAGVTTSPALRPDGTVIQDAGWDPATGYLYAPELEFPRVPEAPTRDDARAALAELREVFAPPGDGHDGFPFRSDADAHVPIAALLTLLARPAIDGPTPAFVFDASTPGSGKTLLADVVCLIATGLEMPKSTFPEKPDELEKMLGGLALQGCAVCGFDNLDPRVPFRGAALDKVLTGQLVQMRILGESKAPVLTWNAVVLATGNNVQVMGDTMRRCLRSRQEPDVERPEERSGFRIPDLRAHVLEHRTRLVRAGLTLLRAYAVAGQPSVGTKPLGSFVPWQRVVASALLWAGGADVLECRTHNDQGDDPELEAAAILLPALHRLGRCVSAGEMIRLGYDLQPNGHGVPLAGSEAEPEIKEALDSLVSRKSNGRPTPKAVGWALKRIQGRVFGGLRLVQVRGSGGGSNHEWKVEQASSSATSPGGSGGSGGSGDYSYPLRARTGAQENGSEGQKTTTGITETTEQAQGTLIPLFRGPLSGPVSGIHGARKGEP